MSREHWRVPEGRKALLALVGIAAAAPGCGDDDGADEQETATTTQAEQDARQGFTGADVVRDVDPIRDEALADYSEFVGAIDGTNIYVAIIAATSNEGDPVAVGYACDGRKVAEVLAGPGGDSLELASEAGAVLTGALENGTASGTLRLQDGRTLDFEAEEVDPEGTAGVFFTNRQVDRDFVGDYGGWIVLPDGSQRGSIRMGTVVLSGGTLDPRTGSVATQGREVLAGQVDAFRSLVPH